MKNQADTALRPTAPEQEFLKPETASVISVNLILAHAQLGFIESLKPVFAENPEVKDYLAREKQRLAHIIIGLERIAARQGRAA